ncbi:20069_t:CDS:2, partial [Racocetra persica]
QRGTNNEVAEPVTELPTTNLLLVAYQYDKTNKAHFIVLRTYQQDKKTERELHEDMTNNRLERRALALTQNERNKVKQRLQNSPLAKQHGTRVIKPTTSYTDYSDNNSKHGTKSDEILPGDSPITGTQT